MTYKLLFQNCFLERSENLKAYENLEAPDFINQALVPTPHRWELSTSLVCGRFRHRRPRSTIADLFGGLAEARKYRVIQEHIGTGTSIEGNPRYYYNFPIFGARIQALKAHMASEKSRGLRQLWDDSRDTLTWYTIWAAFFLGGGSLVLATLSLITSIVQTVVSFKTLNGNPGAPSTP
ncbi:hypothetical protein MMC13_005380 [Lambiella insularis]|nr:hypothetical protein [Lambiella insularis]